jgi:hypothetical protein
MDAPSASPTTLTVAITFTGCYSFSPQNTFDCGLVVLEVDEVWAKAKSMYDWLVDNHDLDAAEIDVDADDDTSRESIFIQELKSAALDEGNASVKIIKLARTIKVFGVKAPSKVFAADEDDN